MTAGTARVVIAPDSFKGSISAPDAAAAIAAGWCSARPGDRIVLLPQADGGEGTMDAVGAAVPDAVVHETRPVTGPDGRPACGRWLELPDGTAVVDLATASGLPLMGAPDPVGAQTTGLGELIGRALDAGMTRLIIGLGGSASTDGGAGALTALGATLRDASGATLAPGGGSLARLASIDLDRLRPAPPDGVILLTDVDAPLLGPGGAAAVFAPQKGATPDQTVELEAALTRFAAVLGGDPSAPGGGAAGGTAFGFAAAWGAGIRPGARYIAELTGLPSALADADVVITGEGRFDATSLAGKVVGELLRAADRHRVAELVVIAGQVATVAARADSGPVRTIDLATIAGSSAKAFRAPVSALREAGRRAAERI